MRAERTANVSWAIGAVARQSHETRNRREHILQRATRIDAWAPAGELKVARRIGRGTSVSAGVVLTQRGAVSVIPTPAALGTVYQSTIAPEIASYASGSVASSGGFTLLHRFVGGAAGWARVGVLTGSPQRASFAAAPTGTRREASFAVGIVTATHGF